jgi:hypothetical protein
MPRSEFKNQPCCQNRSHGFIVDRLPEHPKGGGLIAVVDFLIHEETFTVLGATFRGEACVECCTFETEKTIPEGTIALARSF